MRNDHRGVGLCFLFDKKIMKGRPLSTVFLLFSIILLSGALFHWLDFYSIKRNLPSEATSTTKRSKVSDKEMKSLLNCSNLSKSQIRSSNFLVTSKLASQSATPSSCPEYFRWIHEDLKPWKITGITRDTLESAKQFAHSRLVIANGKLYVEKYKRCFQTRDLFTIWGILQLLKLYPGRVPDLELMLSCSDKPEIERKHYQGQNAASPPPIFQYCGHEESSLNIVLPDWTFWGRPESRIRPWKSLLQVLQKGNKKIKWKDRLPYAFWKGNPNVTSPRGALMRCNVSNEFDWGARLYKQDWNEEAKQGFRNSKLEDQCNYRYKIYVEERGWSVSDKYILACDSMVLFIKSPYYDFFSRSMVPTKHYWHISVKNMCRDIKFAVDWGNNHPVQAQGIGKAGSEYIRDNLRMEYVYDYMFHFLKEYSKLLKFRPAVPERAVEMCSEKLACTNKGLWKEFMLESVVNSLSGTVPCNLPPPFNPTNLRPFFEERKNATTQVEKRD